MQSELRVAVGFGGNEFVIQRGHTSQLHWMSKMLMFISFELRGFAFLEHANHFWLISRAI